MKTKFKKGDKVRILPSAVYCGVDEYAVGKKGKIVGCYREQHYFYVLMDYDFYTMWALQPNQMEPAVTIGQQLLFDFMK